MSTAAHDLHPAHRARRPPQRGQIHSLQPDLWPTQGDHRLAARVHARPQLRPVLLAGGGVRADRHRAGCSSLRDDPLLGPAADQAERAIAESDLVVLVVDGGAASCPTTRPSPPGSGATGKRVIVAVNKAEAGETSAVEFARLGFDVRCRSPRSTGWGWGTSWTRPSPACRGWSFGGGKTALRLAIVGRPNVGKSSLLNRSWASERAVVSAHPGHDPRRRWTAWWSAGGKRYRSWTPPASARAAPEGERRPRERRAGPACAGAG